jgi:hypothetical protein
MHWHLHDAQAIYLATSGLLYALLYGALEISELRARNRTARATRGGSDV